MTQTLICMFRAINKELSTEIYVRPCTQPSTRMKLTVTSSMSTDLHVQSRQQQSAHVNLCEAKHKIQQQIHP